MCTEYYRSIGLPTNSRILIVYYRNFSIKPPPLSLLGADYMESFQPGMTRADFNACIYDACA